MNKSTRTTSLSCESLEARDVPAFLAPVTSPAEFSQSGDFNGDGRADLVSVDPEANAVVVRLGNGNGTFQPARTTGTGKTPALLAVADLNRDGRADLVVREAGKGGSELRVYLGSGSGTFAAGKQSLSLPTLSNGQTQTARVVATSDFNADGKADLAVVGVHITAGRGVISTGYLNVFHGDGAGKFTRQGSPVLAGGGSGTQGTFLTADFTGDGRLDVLAAFAGSNTSMLRSQPDGSYVRTSANTPLYGGKLTAADLNGDGKADVARANAANDTVGVFLSAGDATFASAGVYPAGPGVASVGGVAALQVGDLNGDGRPDLICPNTGTTGSDSVSVLLGNGNGTFQTARTLAAGTELVSIALADFDGDGRIDLARREWNGTADQTSILFNDGAW
jgi:hypothetical protein